MARSVWDDDIILRWEDTEEMLAEIAKRVTKNLEEVYQVPLCELKWVPSTSNSFIISCKLRSIFMSWPGLGPTQARPGPGGQPSPGLGRPCRVQARLGPSFARAWPRHVPSWARAQSRRGLSPARA